MTTVGEQDPEYRSRLRDRDGAGKHFSNRTARGLLSVTGPVNYPKTEAQAAHSP